MEKDNTLLLQSTRPGSMEQTFQVGDDFSCFHRPQPYAATHISFHDLAVNFCEAWDQILTFATILQ